MRTGLLLTSLVFLAAAPAMAQVRGAPSIVAVPTPPLSAVPSSNSGCSPINPCAVATPALGDVVLPTPTPVPAPAPQPATPAAASAPAAAGRGAAPTGRGAAQVQCPPMPGRGTFAGRGGEGRGAFAGRGGEGRGAFAGRGEGRGPAGAGRFGGRGTIPPECFPQGTGRAGAAR